MLKLPAQDRRRVIVEAFVMLTLVFLATLIAFSWVVIDVRNLSNKTAEIVAVNNRLTKESNRLAKENRNRIEDIQTSRTESCQRTYSGVREVFRDLYPPLPRTPEQQERVGRFERRVDSLIAGCTDQTNPRKGK